MTNYRARDYAIATRVAATRVSRALTATAAQITKELRDSGRADVRTAGKFGAWAFSVRNVREGSDRVMTTRSNFVAETLELGTIIRGKPLLWIPISSQADNHMPMRRYPGRLVRVDRPGKVPLQFSGGKPKYFAKSFVAMPKKLHLRAIGRSIMSRAPSMYARNFAQGSDGG